MGLVKGQSNEWKLKTSNYVHRRFTKDITEVVHTQVTRYVSSAYSHPRLMSLGRPESRKFEQRRCITGAANRKHSSSYANPHECFTAVQGYCTYTIAQE